MSNFDGYLSLNPEKTWIWNTKKVKILTIFVSFSQKTRETQKRRKIDKISLKLTPDPPKGGVPPPRGGVPPPKPLQNGVLDPQNLQNGFSIA